MTLIMGDNSRTDRQTDRQLTLKCPSQNILNNHYSGNIGDKIIHFIDDFFWETLVL